MEFEFTQGSLEAVGLLEGDKVECTYSEDMDFTEGCIYQIKRRGSSLCITDVGFECLSSSLTVKFKPVSQPAPQGVLLQDILPDCKEGDLLTCVDSIRYFTVARNYRVVKKNGTLYVEDDDGDRRDSSLALFKPVSQPAPQGVLLQDILPDCKEGDLLTCVDSIRYFTVARNYRVVKKNGTLYVEDDDGDRRDRAFSLFIRLDSTTEDEHDTWGIGKQYKAPKKEWQPDVMDVDLTKKIWEW